MDSATLSRRWGQFQRWRRGRPFWGGLLLVLSGIELFLSSNLDLGAIQIHLGFEGFLSYLLPALMLLTGIFVWFTPKQRVFYGIIGALTAIYSLIGLNLGGFLLGMVIGLVGGALAFAWTPTSTVEGPEAERDPWTEHVDQVDEPAPVRNAAPRHGLPDERDEDEGRPAPGGAPARWSFRFFAILIPMLALAGGLTVAIAPPSQAGTASTARTEPDCQAVAAPAPAATASATPSPTRPPTLLELWWEFWERIFGKNAPKPTQVPSTPPPSVSPTATPTCAPTTAAPTGGPSTSGPGGGGAGDGTSAPSPSGAVPAMISPSPSVAPVVAAAPGQPIVSDHPARMTTSVLVLNRFSFVGVTELPTRSGTIRTLQFSIGRASNQDFRLHIESDGLETDITSDPLVVDGEVKLYTSRFTGSFLGIPLTFTPDFPPPLTLPEMTFTNVNLDLVFLDCNTLDGTGLAIT
jgi:uncharacterized protein DUF6114